MNRHEFTVEIKEKLYTHNKPLNFALITRLQAEDNSKCSN